jgi:hypothetical protein
MRQCSIPIFFALATGACTMSEPINDFGFHRDLSAPGQDLSVTDSAGTDGAPGGGCTQVATWPGLQAQAGFDPNQVLTFAISARQAMEPQDLLALEDWHLGLSGDGGETYPKNVTFKIGGTYATCDVCVRLLEGCTAANGCVTGYFIQGGTVTVTRADTDPVVGRMTATGTNLKLVEWNFPQADDGGITGDTPVPGGKCYDIASLSLDVPWDNTPPDGGTVGGCHPVVNEIMTGSTGSASDEFIELFNPCPSAVDVSGWKLVYRSQNNNNGGADTSLHTFAAGTSIAANGYLVGVNAALTTRAHDFTYTGGLSAKGGAVALRNTTAAVDAIAYQKLLVPNTYTEGSPAPNPPTGGSIGRLPNGTDTDDNSVDVAITTMITPGAANQ